MGTQQRRNVVMIMCDQLRPDFLHAYGADFIPTPNIDALASEGVVFDNAITASTVCGPARMSFLTGLPVSGHDTWTNEQPAREGTEFLPERLTAAGYMTAAVGCYDHFPLENNFGYQYRNVMTGDDKICGYRKYLMGKHPETTTIYPKDDDNRFLYSEEDFYDRWSADRATEFITCYAKNGTAPDGTAPQTKDAPFFLYCGFLSPHGPIIPPREVKGTVDPARIPAVRVQPRPDEDIPDIELYRRAFLNPTEVNENPHVADEARMEERTRYCELIVEIDTLVGRIVQSLKDAGIYENTTILFTSDHGSVGHDYNVVTKGPWAYHSQLFIPMIISNAPELKKGTHCDALCGSLDIGATALELAGDTRAFGLSRSMIGLAAGTTPEREVNLSEFCDGCKTLVDKRYTFTYYPFTEKTCMFDRVADPEETVNISGRPEYAEIERRFMMHIVDFMILAKGVRLEAHDVTPNIRRGIEKKHPKFLDNFDIAFPLNSWEEVERIERAGLDGEYNEFCRGREIKAQYGVYFYQERPKKKQ
ncbi:MAG: sulfatase-like hydrolase/transferase [Clostridia bacterium]|nr:sulfatase-like hydrolase/transferase [Clostridia bacterium]